MNKTKCRFCGKQIIFVRMTSGRPMPCEPEKKKLFKGHTYKMVTSFGSVVNCDLTGEQEDFIGYGYVPHWATCKQAGKTKKSERGKSKSILT